jgi:hypothetical protein
MSDEDTITSGEGQDGPGGGNAPDTLDGNAADEPVEGNPPGENAAPADPADGGEPSPPAPPTPPAEPKRVAETPKIEPDQSPAQKRLAEIEAKVSDDAFDPFSKDGKALILEHSRVAAQVAAEPLSRKVTNATVYDDLSEQYEMPASELKRIWQETKKSIPEQFKGEQGALDYAFHQNVIKAKAQKTPPPAPKKAAPKPTPVISPGQVLPRGVGSVPPQPPPADERTIEERVIAGDPATKKQFADAWSDFFGRK